jgi:metal-responsive CopG/Arc/MetJ family transcriptional regulator
MKHELSERVTVRITEQEMENLDKATHKLQLKTKSELIRMLLSTINKRLFKLNAE